MQFGIDQDVPGYVARGSLRLNTLLGKTTADLYLIKTCIFHQDYLRQMLPYIMEGGGCNQYFLTTIFRRKLCVGREVQGSVDLM